MENLGIVDWFADRDREGHRDYGVAWLIKTDNVYHGPATVMAGAPVPAIGSTWDMGPGFDIDLYAYCWPDWRVTPVVLSEPNDLWILEQHFSTRPIRRCQDTAIENPLLEPPRISGGFIKDRKRIFKDRHGEIIKHPSHEPIMGDLTEFPKNSPTVNIELTVPTLSTLLPTFSEMMDKNAVNDATLWGLPKRCVSLVNASWARHIYGVCSFYYTVAYEFEINFNTFDRKAAAEGSKTLIGWMPGSLEKKLEPEDIDPNTGEAYHLNPQNFEAYKTWNGENGRTFLDEFGRPVFKMEDAHEITVEHHEEYNLLTLGIPSSL